MDRDPGSILVSIIVNWLVGLVPAVILRFAILRRPLQRTASMIVTAIVGLFLFLLVTWFAYLAQVRPNMAPVVLWILLTNWMLRYGASFVATVSPGSPEPSDKAARSSETTTIDLLPEKVLCPKCSSPLTLTPEQRSAREFSCNVCAGEFAIED
jgi:hypothetical protein